MDKAEEELVKVPSRVPTRGGRGPDRKGPPRQPLPAGTILQGGSYRITSVIGEGGFSITYLGQEGSRRLTVAIKEFFPLGCLRHGSQVVAANHWDARKFSSALAVFLGEGKLLQRFQHPGIVRAWAPFEENNTAYLAMEFLQGESLLEGLQRRGPMNQAQALEVARQVGSALEMVHAGGLLHSDIKPENIIRTDEGRLVLLDFGVSRGYLSSRSAKGAVAAVSPGYSPPEQYVTSTILTPASDIYSLAACLYSLLSYRLPPDAVTRHKGTILPSLVGINPTVTPRFWQALEESLAMDPLARPQSVSDLLYRLGCHEKATSDQVGLAGSAAPTRLELEATANFEAHKGPISGLQIHPHQHMLMSGSKTGNIKLWSWPDAKPQGILNAHKAAVTAFAMSADAKFLASADETGEVKLWSLEGASLLRVVRSGWPTVHDLAFVMRGQGLAIALGDGTIQVFFPHTQEPVILAGHTGVVTSLSVSPDETMMASGSHDFQVIIWDLASCSVLSRLSGHDRAVQRVAFSPDSNLVISASNDLSAVVWDVGAGLELRKLRHGAIVWCGGFTCDPDIVVTGSADKKVRLFSLKTGREVGCADADRNFVRAVSCDLRYRLLATGGGDGHVRIWKF